MSTPAFDNLITVANIVGGEPQTSETATPSTYPGMTEAQVNQQLYGGQVVFEEGALAQGDAVSIEVEDVTQEFSSPAGFFSGAHTMAGPAFSGVWRQVYTINDTQNSNEEEFFLQLDTQAQDPLQAAFDQSQDVYMPKRRQLLGGVTGSGYRCFPGQPKLAHLSLTDAMKTRLGGSWDLSTTAGFTDNYTGLSPADTLWKALRIRLRAKTVGSSPLYGQRFLYLRGIPDGLILSAKYDLTNNSAWDTRWKAYREMLIGGTPATGPLGNANSGYGMLIHDDRAASGNQRRIVTKSEIADGKIRLTIATAAPSNGNTGLADRDFMQLSQANVPGWNGEYEIRKVGTTQVDLIEPVRGQHKYIFDILRDNPAALPKITFAKLMRLRKGDGSKTWEFGKFYEMTLDKIVRKRPSPAWSPYQKHRQASA